jgi:ELWxxDGT repeat protein
MKTQAFNLSFNHLIRLIRLSICFLFLTVLTPSGYSQISLVKKTYEPNGTSSYAYEFQSMTLHKGNLYFIFNNELWKSNGTSAGTVLLKTFNALSTIVSSGNYIYFIAEEHPDSQMPKHGTELWRSDGTTAGTVLVKDIFAGVDGSYPKYLTNVNGTLYFTSNNAINGYELWKTNGSPEGTVLVKDILKVAGSSNPQYLTALNGKVYFRANDGMNGYELWRSDGTAAGTILVKDINTSYKASSFPQQITNVNGTLYMFATDGLNGKQLWKSTGEPGNGVMVKAIRPGGTNSIDLLTKVNDLVFFQANDGIHGVELWRSNGTAAGTFMVKDMTPGPGSAVQYATPHIANPTESNGKLYFQGVALDYQDLWVSDGTTAGTYPITSGNNPGFAWTSHGSVAYNGLTYFGGMSHDESSYLELWKTDGTVAGTVKVHENIGDGYYLNLMGTILNGSLYFIGSGDLWKTDGTTAGTLRLKYFNVYRDSSPAYLTDLNGQLLFSATDGTSYRTLWKTNGTEAGTVKLSSTLTNAGNIVNVNGVAYFGGQDSRGLELWKTNGSTGGTVLVKDIIPTPGSNAHSNPHGFTLYKSEVYFSAQTAYHGFDLWKTNGTAAGTRAVDPAGPEVRQFNNPEHLTVAGDKLFFTAGSNLGDELFVYDGVNVPRITKDIKINYQGSHPIRLTPFNNILYFQADNRGNGYELYRSDGTVAGTYIMKDIRLNDLGTDTELAVLDMGDMIATPEALYFLAIRGSGVNALWRSDGTSAGTKPYFDLPNAYVDILGTDGNTFYFTVPTDYGVPLQLWKSNGTPGSTVKVKDMTGIDFFLKYVTPKKLNGVLYFVGYTDPYYKLWRTDGTAAGTYHIPFDGSPWELAVSGGKVYMGGNSVDFGYQLFLITDNGIPALARVDMSEETEFAEAEQVILNTAYPNPFNSEFKIKMEGTEGEVFKVTIMNGNGETISTKELEYNIENNLGSDLKPGLYLLRIQTNAGVSTERVMKRD